VSLIRKGRYSECEIHSFLMKGDPVFLFQTTYCVCTYYLLLTPSIIIKIIKLKKVALFTVLQ
jgi:hypothetical protein